MQESNENKEQPRTKRSDYKEDVIDLTLTFKVLWRRRIYMLMVFTLVMFLAVTYIILSTPKYRIAAQISLRKMIHDNLSKNDVAAWFNEKSYMAESFDPGLSVEDLSDFKATTERGDSNNITIGFNHPDPEKGISLMKLIIGRGEETFTSQLKDMAEMYQNKIITAQSHVELRGSITKNLKNRLSNMRSQINLINVNTQKILESDKNIISSNPDRFTMLMLSNIIKLQLQANLERDIADLEMQLNEVNIGELQKREQLIDLMQAHYNFLRPIKIVQPPFSSPKPVKPAVLKTLTLSIILVVILAPITALVVEFVALTRR